MTRKSYLLILAFIVLGVCTANSRGMGPEARVVLINKFQKLYFQLPPADEVRVGVTLRLADLLSERARYESMKELESGCITCNAGEKDRAKAVKYYKEVMPKIKDRQKAKVMAQLGHLYEMLGQKNRAIDLYYSIINANYSERANKREVSEFFIRCTRANYSGKNII